MGVSQTSALIIVLLQRERLVRGNAVRQDIDPFIGGILPTPDWLCSPLPLSLFSSRLHATFAWLIGSMLTPLPTSNSDYTYLHLLVKL
jgi:hypothetical protein